MTLPIRSVTQPRALAGQSNGKLPPSRLVDTPGQAGGPVVRLLEVAARGWRAMCAAARAGGHVLKATSLNDSYRPYAVQESLFRRRYSPTFLAGRPTRTWNGNTWWQRPNTAVAAVPGTCVEGDAIVLTRDGLMAISAVRVGDEVWTHEHRWRPVIQTTSFQRPVVRVTGAGHPGIDVTREHRWWVFDGWHRAATVRRGISNAGTQLKVRSTPDIVGDLWLSPEYIDGVDAPDYATPEWLRWAGAWVADGSLHYVNGVLTEGLIYPRHSKAGQIEEWAAAAGVALTENADRNDGTRRFRFGRGEARRLEAHFGRLSTERTVPAWLLANAQKLGEPFLVGFLHGDGHRTTNPAKTEHWSFSTSSRRLAVGLRMAAQAIGWHAYISDRRWAQATTVKGRRCAPTAETWVLAIYEAKPPTGTRLWDHQGYVVGRVRRVFDGGETRTVYDLTVADDESFCVDGIFTHNSNHGLGLAVDVGEERDGDAGTESIDAGTVAWLIGNAHLYGFSAELQSEPWHWRYFAGDAIPPAVLAFEQGGDMYEQYDRDRLNATLGKVEAIEEAVAKLAAPQVTVDLGDLASRVLANAGFADAIATAVADKLAARLKE